VIASAAFAAENGLKPLARIVAYSSHAQAPSGSRPHRVPAIAKGTRIRRWKARTVDLFEINEAFRLRDDGGDQDLE